MEIILELGKWIGIMTGTAVGLHLLLRPKMKIELKIREIVLLPFSVLLEEVIFRLLAFWILGFISSNPMVLIAGSTIPFTLTHLVNLQETVHSSWDIPKYLMTIGTLGAILGYIHLNSGFWFTFAVHVLYDLLVIGISLIFKEEKKN